MGKYYVVGLTHRDIMAGIQLRMLKKITERDVVPETEKDLDRALIYTKETDGEYATLEYIHESVYHQLSGICGLKHIEILDEKELPKDISAAY